MDTYDYSLVTPDGKLLARGNIRHDSGPLDLTLRNGIMLTFSESAHFKHVKEFSLVAEDATYAKVSVLVGAAVVAVAHFKKR